jgi:TetR/AcrR family transcriptional regulator, repressor of fatR-cypB operon
MAVDLVGQQRLDRVLDAALTLFDSTGYGNTPMPDIAREAGIAVGSIYRSVESKEALANELFRREKRRLAAASFGGVDLDGPPAEVFAVVWRRLVDFAVATPAALCFLELHHHDAYLDAESRALVAEIDGMVGSLFRRWQNLGAIRPGDPDMQVAQVLGGLVGVVRVCRGIGRPITEALFDLTVGPAWALLSCVHSSSASSSSASSPKSERRSSTRKSRHD